MNHLTQRWAGLQVPYGAQIGSIYDEHLWWHYSTTGQIRGPLLHAGTLMAAREREHSLHAIHRQHAPEDFHTPLPTRWIPQFGADGKFALYLKRPVQNPGKPITDAAANQDDISVPLLYRNDFEGGISVVAPVNDFVIVGFMGDDTNLWSFDPHPVSEAPEIAKAFHLYDEQQRLLYA